MKRILLRPIFGVVVAVALFACSDDDNVPGYGDRDDDTPGVIELSAIEQDAVEKCNDFGFKMLNIVSGSDAFVNENISLSPASFSYAFSMLANGANGETREQIVKALGYDVITINEINDLNNKMTGELSRLDANVMLSFANSLWAIPAVPVNEVFVSSLANYYDADTKQIYDDTFISDINAWCTVKTNGRITEFMNEGDKVPTFALFNAAYFKGQWNKAYKFDPKNTREGYFNDSQGSRSVAKFMKQDGVLTYSETPTMQKCELPFGNTSFRASFILPKEDVSIEQALDNLAGGDWKQLREPYQPEPPYGLVSVALTLPKFKIETDVVFNQFMSALGMPDVLSEDADYSNITDADVVINNVKQKATFEISEEGAEASAVTGITGDILPNPDFVKNVTMTFDRPFIYVIYEHSTGVILFAGCVNSFSK
ncbi:MAG: serpin family protein [Barnesiella sp.]|nr:serpin family protein [Barnesiella sp.]